VRAGEIVPRKTATALLGGASVLLAGVLGFVGATGVVSLRPVAFASSGLVTVGVAVGAPWSVTAAVALLAIEWGVALALGSVPAGWIPALAVGLYLVVESSVSVLERRGAAVSPREPGGYRLVGVAAMAAGVWIVARVVLWVSGVGGSGGALGQIAGVAAATSVLTMLRWLLRRRLGSR
jgi:hypothetical protein